MSRYFLYNKQKRSKKFLVLFIFFMIIAGGVILKYHFISFNHDKKGGSTLSNKRESSKKYNEQNKLALSNTLPWPTYGQAAFGIESAGVVAKSSNEPKSVPIASVAKIITALAVLNKKPLSPGEQGPTITLNEKDISYYEKHYSQDGSVVQVMVGEQITEYQALQAMLLPSANNISDSLADWAFGSQENYVKFANQMLKDMGLNNTKVADASGFSPNTVSTAPELVKLGIIYMNNPILKEIAMQNEAEIPVAGKILNYNAGVNKNGVIGIKVGYTDEAGRTFLAASINSQQQVSVAAVLGANDFPTVMNDTANILQIGNDNINNLP